MSLVSNIGLLATKIGQELKLRQPLDADLTAIAALTSVADRIPYSTGSGTWALNPFTSWARGLVSDNNSSEARNRLDVYSKTESGSLFPGSEMGSAERTSNFTSTNTTYGSTATASIISGFSVTVVGEGRPVDIEFNAIIQQTTSSARPGCYLLSNGSVNAPGGQLANTSAPTANTGMTIVLKKRAVLTSGVTYKFEIGIYASASSTIQVTASSAIPAALTVTRR